MASFEIMVAIDTDQVSGEGLACRYGIEISGEFRADCLVPFAVVEARAVRRDGDDQILCGQIEVARRFYRCQHVGDA